MFTTIIMCTGSLVALISKNYINPKFFKKLKTNNIKEKIVLWKKSKLKKHTHTYY